MFRAAAMLPDDKYVVLNMEHGAAPLRVFPNSFTSTGGFVDYIALVESDPEIASELSLRRFHFIIIRDYQVLTLGGRS